MGEKKQQHYVPACYLANFGIYGNQGRDSKVYFCNISDLPLYNKVQERSINYFPVVKNFYDIPELEDNVKALEEFFCQIEGEYSTLLKKAICYAEASNKKQVVLSADDKEKLVGHFAMQYVRTEFFRNNYHRWYNDIKNDFPQADIPEYTKDDFRRLHTTALSEFEMANFYANLLKDRNWVFLINHTKQPFFTSDNPAIFINHSSNMCELSPVSDKTTFFIPLSPTVAVELYCKNISPKPELFFDIYLSKTVTWYNLNLKERCMRFMMSNQNDFSYILGCDEKNE